MKHSARWLIGMMVLFAVTPMTGWAASPSSGCTATSGLLTASGTYTMSYGGLNRTFRLHVPTGYSPTVPKRLVTIYHGWGGNESEFIGNNTVTSLANARGYILVAPRGLGSGAPDNKNNSWSFKGSTTGLDGDGGAGIDGAVCDYTKTTDYSYPSCSAVKQNTCSWTQCQQDDVAFAVALVQYIENKMCVDASNVFATGGSNGGMFTWELGQNPVSAPTFRAIAPLIGLPHRGYLAGPGKSVEMPALVITGTLDKTVPPGAWDNPAYTTTSDGDFYYYTGATAITKSWAAAHGCTTVANAVSFNEGSTKTDCRTYCSAIAPAWPKVLDCRAKMGHTYNLSWAWKIILDFFDKQTI